jgi:hypothetical protein
MQFVKLLEFRAAVSAVILLLTGACSNQKPSPPPEADPSVRSFVEAAKRIQELRNEGKLPGFTANERGFITSHRIQAGEKPLNYPRRVSMQIEKTGDSQSIYWFVVEKQRENQGWEITEAWQTDFRGENRKILVGK